MGRGKNVVVGNRQCTEPAEVEASSGVSPTPVPDGGVRDQRADRLGPSSALARSPRRVGVHRYTRGVADKIVREEVDSLGDRLTAAHKRAYAKSGIGRLHVAFTGPGWRQAASFSRSFDSMFGNTLESLLARLESARCGKATGPIAGRGVDPAEMGDLSTAGDRYPDGRTKPVIYSRADPGVLRALASELVDFISETGHKVGSPEFEQRYLEAFEQVTPLAEGRVVGHVLDFWSDDDIGYGEVKAGGQLDNKKSDSEVQKMLVSALALTEPRLPKMFFCYAPDGNLKAKGSITRFLEEGHMVVEERLWNRVLPIGTTYDDLVEMIEKKSKRFRKFFTT